MRPLPTLEAFRLAYIANLLEPEGAVDANNVAEFVDTFFAYLRASSDGVLTRVYLRQNPCLRKTCHEFDIHRGYELLEILNQAE